MVGRVGRGGAVAARVLLGLTAAVEDGMSASCTRDDGRAGGDLLVPRVALRVAGVVGAELTSLLPVLESAVLRWTVGVCSLRRAVSRWRVVVLAC